MLLDRAHDRLVAYLQEEYAGQAPFVPSDPAKLIASIGYSDVLLIEGRSRVARVIRYLTNSTWSHAALYVGPIADIQEPDGEPHVLVEAELGVGVSTAPLSKYYKFHTRICRPIGLTYEDSIAVCRYAINRIGFDYDTKNITDMLRYLLPMPVPRRWRRQMLAFGSSDPTRLICSTLIAQAFGSVRYPILPSITHTADRQTQSEILHIRDTSLYTPRDFDISPYFAVVKPTIAAGFDYKTLQWADVETPTTDIRNEAQTDVAI